MAQLKSTSITGTLSVTGKATFEAPANIAGTEQTTTKFKTSNGGSVTIGKEGPNSGTMLRFDQVDGTERLKFRASATAGAMIWSQPEANATLYMDLSDSGGVTKRITFNALQLSHPVKISAPTIQGTTFTNGTNTYTPPSSTGTLALTSQLPTLVAGTNITIDVDGNEYTINSSGGGGDSTTPEITVATSGSVSQTIEANKYYKFTDTEITDLNITTTTKIADILNEFMFEFIGSSTPTALKVINADSTISASIGTSTGITGALVTKSTFENLSVVNGVSGEYTFIYDSELTGVITTGAGLSNLTLTKSTFETKITTAGTYVFTYSSADTSWMFNSSAVTLATYGIEVGGTPADGDTLTLTYSFRWEYSGAEITLSTYGITVTGTPAYNDEVIVTYNGIKWYGDLLMEEGLTYQISIVNDVGIIMGV